MSVSVSQMFQQGPSIRTLFSVGFGSLIPRRKRIVQAPGPLVTQTIKPRSPKLVEAYVDWTQANPEAYAGQLPPHMFPQWAFPPMAKALGAVPWPMTKILNQGCRLEVKAPLMMGEPLHVSAQVLSIQEDEFKARITTRVITGTAQSPEAIIADCYAVVPLAKKKGNVKREPPLVPAEARDIEQFSLTRRSGLDFALLTGDFNLIHWVSWYARLAGFKTRILHGFASMALSWEAIVRRELDGDPSRMASMDVRFVRPQFLPEDVSVCIGSDQSVAIGAGPGERATMLGSFKTQNAS
jgi:hypothetical protein